MCPATSFLCLECLVSITLAAEQISFFFFFFAWPLRGYKKCAKLSQGHKSFSRSTYNFSMTSDKSFRGESARKSLSDWVIKAQASVLFGIESQAFGRYLATAFKYYSILPNRHVYTFISGKVCLLASIKVKRQTLPEINIQGQLFWTLEYLRSTTVKNNLPYFLI